MENTTPSPESIFKALLQRGWCFKDAEAIHTLIQSKLPAGESEMCSLDSIQSELLNMDLRDIGGKSLPDPSSLKKSSHLQGPKILQLVSVKDIYQSNIDASISNSQRKRRLLKFCLTDGCSQVIAIEYLPIPAVSEEIAPGTKVLLENRVPICNGILCLDSKTATILGGLVQSLYEEWQMSQKYSGFSRSSLISSKNSDGVGPPPFEKFQIGKQPRQVPRQQVSHDTYSHPSKSNLKDACTLGRPRNSSDQQIVDSAQDDSRENKADNDPKLASFPGSIDDKPSSSQSRPKEVSEAIPVQNQAAAQKLLQKMSYPTREDRRSRGPKYRGKGQQEEQAVFTLDEWERRKGMAKPTVKDTFQDVSQDEELAWQLQNQLDFEDFNVKTDNEAQAEQLRKSMFNFGREEESRHDGRKEFRGRGRGRGSGRGRGRGRRGFG
eukprot:TRINITY_DN3521_c0_g1_i1.p1 TRINITY_DN3521_c0_g1~~TRINITY_DN3521_c0_g1_i1.p1  ORF type:complete len:436 (+),score=110.10 TRINITY_DN3521_c0_g1_i1:166-1473(+)